MEHQDLLLDHKSFYSTNAAGTSRKQIMKRAEHHNILMAARVLSGQCEHLNYMMDALESDPGYFLRRSSPIIWG